MLENTFIHIPGFSHRRERRLWERGILCWGDFLERFGSSPYQKRQCEKIAGSSYALKISDGAFFAESLPKNEAWRAFPHFKRVAYLDIETTGLAPQTDHLTVIGVFDGKKTKSYIHGDNLGGFPHDIRAFDMVVTFNGSMFDIPFLKKSFPGIAIPPLHIDLRFLLASLDVRGGLKKIEQRFGFEREDDLKGLDGYSAVLLWQAFSKRRDRDALDKLVRYNSADIANLKKLLEWAYGEKRIRTGFDEIKKNER